MSEHTVLQKYNKSIQNWWLFKTPVIAVGPLHWTCALRYLLTTTVACTKISLIVVTLIPTYCRKTVTRLHTCTWIPRVLKTGYTDTNHLDSYITYKSFMPLITIFDTFLTLSSGARCLAMMSLVAETIWPWMMMTEGERTCLHSANSGLFCENNTACITIIIQLFTPNLARA